jgi:hypothetical protein
LGAYAPRPGMDMPAAAIAISTSTLAGLLMMVVSIDFVQRYGIAIFFTVPFVIGAVGAFIVNYDTEASMARTGQVTLAAFVLAAILALVLGREGAVCIVLALPLLASVGLLGAALGRSLARSRRGGAAPALITLMALPVAILIEPAHTSGRLLHEVTTAVVIEAPPERVWPQVVSFDGLAEPDDVWFRLGIAYPLYARTTGAGVGAPRACVFSTGTFAERITRWEPGRRLTFAVLSSASPLRELTPYANVHPPHLDGYFRSPPKAIGNSSPTRSCTACTAASSSTSAAPRKAAAATCRPRALRRRLRACGSRGTRRCRRSSHRSSAPTTQPCH